MRSLYPIHEDAEGLNESPSKKEGKSFVPHGVGGVGRCLNESPSKKEGK